MAKSRSGYKRRYQAPEGEKVPITEPTYQRLTLVAHANRCAIGQWCEAKLRQFLDLRMMPPPAPDTTTAHSPIGMKQREVQLDDRLFIEIAIFAETRGMSARQWLRSVLLYCLSIEEERMRGVKEEPERFR